MGRGLCAHYRPGKTHMEVKEEGNEEKGENGEKGAQGAANFFFRGPPWWVGGSEYEKGPRWDLFFRYFFYRVFELPSSRNALKT
jgi:hypothetical protein